MTIQRLLRTATLVAVGMVGCASVVSAEPLKAEVIHWWTSAGETRALKQFANAFNAAGGEWLDNAVAGGLAARQATISRIVAGDPPAAAQFNTSRDFEELIERGLLRSLELEAQAGNWRDVIPESLVRLSSRDGKFYALPVNIHGRNWVWYNTQVLEEAGATVPTGWGDDMFEALDKVKASGKLPLVIGGNPGYETLFFHSVMLGVGGVDLWMNAYGERNKGALTGPAMREVFETYGRLRAYVDEGSPGRPWNIAINLVITGKAAFAPVGDWAKGEFAAAGMTAGKEYGCFMPGGIMAIGGDVFIFPVLDDTEQEKAQDLLIQTIADKKALREFNRYKGSVPARVDVDMGGTDICAEAAMAALQKKEMRAPRSSMLLPADTDGEIRDLISEYWNDPSMTVDEAVERHAEILLDG